MPLREVASDFPKVSCLVYFPIEFSIEDEILKWVAFSVYFSVVCVYESQRSTVGSFLYHFSTLFLEAGSSIEPRELCLYLPSTWTNGVYH